MSKKEVLLLIVAVPVLLLAFNAAVHLMSIENDFAVAGGALLLVAVLYGSVLLSIRYVKMAYAKWNLAIALLAIVAATSNTGCYKIVEPGHVGLLVKQTGTERGIQDYPIQTGRVFYNPINESVLEYPVSVQRAAWTRSTAEGHPSNEEISFQSKEGVHFTADVNCSYEMERDKVPHFYMRFRNVDIDTFTHGFLRDTVRNAFDLATDYTAEEINGSKQGELIKRVSEKVATFSEPFGVHIVQLGFSAPPRPPDQVKNAIEGKVAAIQDAEKIKNQVQSSINEGERMKALALAQAEANRVTQASITPTLIEWEKVKKWDGRLPQVSGAVPMVNLK